MKKSVLVGRPAEQAGKKYKTRKEMADKFEVDVRTIDNWRRNYRMPWLLVGGQVRFKERAVEAWAETSRRGRPVPGMV